MKVLFESEHICRPLPVNVKEEDKHFFQLSEKDSWPITYQILNNKTANSELFLKKNFRISPISFGDKWQDAKYNRFPYLVKNKVKDVLRKSRREQSVLWVLGQFSTGGYYHWLTEILPRIWCAEQAGVSSDVPLFFPAYFFEKWSFGHDLLRPFNRSCQTFGFRELLKVGTVHSISQPGGPLCFQSKPLKAVKKRLIDYYYDPNYAGDFSKVYLSRNKGAKRVLLNEEKLLSDIQKAGYRVIHSEQLSVRDQVNIFCRCSELFSIHGAGLTNMLFMEPDSKVVEIRNKINDHMNNCFLALSDTLGHKYLYLMGDVCQQSGELRPIDFSMFLDSSQLNELFQNTSCS